VVLAALAAGALYVGRRPITRKVEHVLERIGLASDAPKPTYLGPKGSLDVGARQLGPHPRILLTSSRLAALRDAGTTGSKSLFDGCQKTRAENIGSGYEAWDWAHAALDLALCAKISGDATYRAAGMRYFGALLDDKSVIGDGQGGDFIVRHDDGYSIRTHGWIGAIAYDWLADAPEMTPAVRRKAMDRFVAWTAWFKEKGYSRQNPISNYYASYFGAVAFAGLAGAGEDARADALSKQGETMWNQEIVPTFQSKLAGGDFPEGWQYGDLVGILLALYADAESRAHPTTARPLRSDLPWLEESIALREAALLPDGKHTYDGGDWSNKPAVAPPEMLSALAIVLPDGHARDEAGDLAQLARRGAKSDWKWLEALAPDPARPLAEPFAGPMSYFAKGTASIFARTSWGGGAVWFSLASAPTLSDHQHLDAGHIELVRGADPLLIDAGDYGAYSSLSHNVILVDDPLQSSNPEEAAKTHPIITYKGNQGRWSDTARIARFEDGGAYVYALADYASAFNPAGYPKERTDRAVSRAEREVFFSRRKGPDDVARAVGGVGTGRLVVYDRITTTDPRFTTTFVLHGGRAPLVEGARAQFTTGRSTAWVTTLLPAGATSSVVDETHNTYSNDKAFFTNKPPDGVVSFRYEVASPTSPPSTERRFLHEVLSGEAGDAARDAARLVEIRGDHAAGVAVDGEAYVFSSDGPSVRAGSLTYRAPVEASSHVVADLAPSAGYALSAVADGGECRVTLAPGGAKSASAAGVLAFDLTRECAVR
jgi:hypothetical protein